MLSGKSINEIKDKYQFGIGVRAYKKLVKVSLLINQIKIHRPWFFPILFLFNIFVQSWKTSAFACLAFS